MKTKRITTVRISGEIPPSSVAAALRDIARLLLPRDAQGKIVDVQIRVPSGGDYSGVLCEPEDFEFHWTCTYTEESDV